MARAPPAASGTGFETKPTLQEGTCLPQTPPIVPVCRCCPGLAVAVLGWLMLSWAGRWCPGLVVAVLGWASFTFQPCTQQARTVHINSGVRAVTLAPPHDSPPVHLPSPGQRSHTFPSNLAPGGAWLPASQRKDKNHGEATVPPNATTTHGAQRRGALSSAASVRWGALGSPHRVSCLSR